MYMRVFTFIILFLYFLLSGCAKEESFIEVIEEKEIDLQMIDAYQEGIQALEDQDGLEAAKKFSEAELLYPQSTWAPRAALMAAYSYYSNEYYSEAIYELERFLTTYPKHQRIDYAYYLLGVTYYDKIVDETKDLESMIKSQEYFRFVIKTFPDTDYAIDSKFKLELINEILASKEMYLARYYLDKEKWIPAINRFKIIVEKYDDTVFIEEALHRLVEIHYKIGLVEESKKYAYLLGYNYQSSEWYKNTYKVFNKTYEPRKKIKKNNTKNSLIEKIKKKIF
mgnify:FL=1